WTLRVFCGMNTIGATETSAAAQVPTQAALHRVRGTRVGAGRPAPAARQRGSLPSSTLEPGCRSSGAVRVVATQPMLGRPVAAPGWLLPVFLASECGEVEPVVGPDEHVAAAAVRRVGVEDAVCGT